MLFTSMFNIVVFFLVATKTFMDVSRLSMTPSPALFLLVLVARNPGAEAIEELYPRTFAVPLAILAVALGAVTLVTIKRLRER